MPRTCSESAPFPCHSPFLSSPLPDLLSPIRDSTDGTRGRVEALHLLELQTVRRGRLPDTLIPREPVTHPATCAYLLPGGVARREIQ